MKISKNPSKDIIKIDLGLGGYRTEDKRKVVTVDELVGIIKDGGYERYHGMDECWTCFVEAKPFKDYYGIVRYEKQLFIFGTKKEHRELESKLEGIVEVTPKTYVAERNGKIDCDVCGFCMDYGFCKI